MSERLRWMKFWPADWQRDPALRMCGLAARGLWIECIAIMHEAEPYGHLTINGRAPTPRQLGSIIGVPEKETTKLLAELEEAGVFSRTAQGVIFSRRMVRDNLIRAKARDDGRRGGNPALKAGADAGLSGGVNPTLKLQEAEAEAEEETEKNPPPPTASAPPKGARAARGHRLPDDWAPSRSDCDFAATLGMRADEVAGEFRDYWTSVPGAKGVKLDWSATFRNSVRMLASRRTSRPGSAKPASKTEWAYNDMLGIMQ